MGGTLAMLLNNGRLPEEVVHLTHSAGVRAALRLIGQPRRRRYLGSELANGVSRFAGFGNAFVIAAVAATFGFGGVFALTAVFILLCSLTVGLGDVRTRGRRLEEIGENVR